MMIPAPRLSPAERALLASHRALSAGDRATLLAFAQFLASRASTSTDAGTDASTGAEATAEPRPTCPVPEPRPPQESVIAAIRRLRRVYPMLDGGKMLNETSALMSAHVLQGRAAVDVIDELEVLFAARYAEMTAPSDSPE